MTVVPRLTASLTQGVEPGGQAEIAWGDTWVAVPSWKAGSLYLNLLTGERHETMTREDRQVLHVGQVLNDCPVALLERCS